MKTKKLTTIFILALLFLLPYNNTYAFNECADYGFMAIYDSLTDTCKCMSGYVMDKDFLGNTTCVSGNTVCRNKYGFNSRYDSLSDSCECFYGYVMDNDSIGRTQCISQDERCRNQLGFSSRYNILSGKCECSYGNMIDNGKCSPGSLVCTRKHGIYADFDSLSSSCKCDDDYIFDESDQCVEKQHNVYFALIELDTYNRDAIIKSDYDNGYYRVSYGLGCLDGTFEKYIDKKIVVNLGIDYSIDGSDNIVLQEDDQVCNIINVRYADSTTTLFPAPEGTEINIKTQNQGSNQFSNDNGKQSGSLSNALDWEDSSAMVKEEAFSDKQGFKPWYQRFFAFIGSLFN